MNQLAPYGWTDEFYQKWVNLNTTCLLPARVIADFGTSLRVAMPEIHTAEITGKMAHYSDRQDIPKVGDWVAVRLSDSGNGAVIEQIVPRRSELARKVAGDRTIKQVIAANIDLAFVLLALDNDFSIKRLERFLYQLSASNIDPIIVLNKADKTEDLESFTAQLGGFKIPILVMTAISSSGVDEVLSYISPGKTAILLGSSGVGKSTLTNKLLGREAQETQEVRLSDSTGKHTTVHRELFVLPNGGLLVDTPGIRELQLWGTEEELAENFDDITALVRQCKYTTCRHNDEEGCAVQAALREGSLDPAHYKNYQKMKIELVGLKAKNAVKAKLNNKKSRKNLRRQDRDSRNDFRDEMS